jgi:hypothetical protein
MKAAAISFAVWVFAVPCVVAAFLTLAFLAHSAYGVALFLALSLTAAATVLATFDLPVLRDSSHRRPPAVLNPHHSQEKTHANCFDSQLGS